MRLEGLWPDDIQLSWRTYNKCAVKKASDSGRCPLWFPRRNKLRMRQGISLSIIGHLLPDRARPWGGEKWWPPWDLQQVGGAGLAIFTVELVHSSWGAPWFCHLGR